MSRQSAAELPRLKEKKPTTTVFFRVRNKYDSALALLVLIILQIDETNKARPRVNSLLHDSGPRLMHNF
jgi:hypothetical protein